jgi:hypothetical protein
MNLLSTRKDKPDMQAKAGRTLKKSRFVIVWIFFLYIRKYKMDMQANPKKIEDCDRMNILSIRKDKPDMQAKAREP